MNCPKCNRTNIVKHGLTVASDGSYVYADFECPCGADGTIYWDFSAIIPIEDEGDVV